MPKRTSSKGWKVWVWRAPSRHATTRLRWAGVWWVHVLQHSDDEPKPKGGLQNAGAVTYRLAVFEWIAQYGGKLSDIPRKPTLMVLHGKATKVTK